MEHPVMLLVWLLEKIGLGHFAHAYPHLIYSWLFMILLIVVGRAATKNLAIVPGRLQNVTEVIVESIGDFQDGVMGKEGRTFFPMMATLIIFVLVCNVNGLIPGSHSPTSNKHTTLAFAIIIVFTTHIVGLKRHRLKYIKHFMGPVPFMVPLMLPVEIVSHLARLLSLSLRLFGNVMGEDLVIAILFFLGGAFFLPLPMMFLGLFTGFLQAFVITLLAMLYISEAMAHSH